MTSPQSEGRCWIWWDEHHRAQVSFVKPLPRHEAVEYMRVLSRKEVEKLASDEGVDVMQMVNSLHRTVEGQRKHIADLQRKIEEIENPSAHAAAGVTGHD